MTSLYRNRVAWSGGVGGPGVSTFYGTVEGAMTPNLYTLFDSIKLWLPANISVQVESAGDVIDDVTGDLTGGWSTDPVASITGTGSGNVAAPSGMQFQWLTSTVVDGHRLRGRTFIVPTIVGIYDTDGTLSAASRADAQDQVDAFFALVSGDMAVWHRPRAAKAADGSRHAVTARVGSNGLVTAGVVSDKVVVLRSRRD